MGAVPADAVRGMIGGLIAGPVVVALCRIYPRLTRVRPGDPKGKSPRSQIPDISAAVRGLLLESRVDHVGLWNVIWSLRHLGLTDDARIMRTTLDMLLP